MHTGWGDPLLNGHPRPRECYSTRLKQVPIENFIIYAKYHSNERRRVIINLNSAFLFIPFIESEKTDPVIM